MPRYRVLQDGWTDASGKHAEGDMIMLTRDSPAEEVEVDRLIDYKIIEPATMTAEEAEQDAQDEQETTPARRRAVKK
jgi:hypothetical protein